MLFILRIASNCVEKQTAVSVVKGNIVVVQARRICFCFDGIKSVQRAVFDICLLTLSAHGYTISVVLDLVLSSLRELK